MYQVLFLNLGIVMNKIGKDSSFFGTGRIKNYVLNMVGFRCLVDPPPNI